MARKNRGRQKIEMVKMKNENNLQVTFSKRRSGLFKKASELCTLCDAEIVIIVFSPARKVFSFGHPNVNVLIDRFLNFNPPHPHQHNNIQLNEARRNAIVQDLNNHLTQVTEQLEEERKRNEDLKKRRKESKKAENWWEEEHIGTFSLTQLTEFKCGLENMRKAVRNEASKYLQATDPRHDFYVGSSSHDAAFGISCDDGNINTELDLFNHPRSVSMNTSSYNHHNMIDPNHHTSHFGNDNIIEGFVPDYNQNSQGQCFKQEDTSEYDHDHDHPPHF
ncbi:unnamed protein product [Arabis nemorensis]|uniref:MADS-box domain-containing protein n=1 Tax=Arabis nemorensis TaxID=586526 RepID=A0A565B9D4_9BRAS|nr:unnamed protein product [Arabis nemorensis]